MILKGYKKDRGEHPLKRKDNSRKAEKKGPKGISNPLGPSHSGVMENPFHDQRFTRNFVQLTERTRKVDLCFGNPFFVTERKCPPKKGQSPNS